MCHLRGDISGGGGGEKKNFCKKLGKLELLKLLKPEAHIVGAKCYRLHIPMHLQPIVGSSVKNLMQ